MRRNEDNRIFNFDQYVQTQWEPAAAWRLLAGIRHSTLKIASHDKFIAAGNLDDSGSTGFSAVAVALAVGFCADSSPIAAASLPSIRARSPIGTITVYDPPRDCVIRRRAPAG